MRIAVFGLGYVGSVTAACLAKLGHHVVGVDVQPFKVERLKAGLSAIIEGGLEALVSEGAREGRLTATTDPHEAVAGTEAALICVGTPSKPDGSVDLAFIRRVATEIGEGMGRARDGRRRLLMVRSTLPPGTTQSVIVPRVEEASRLRAGKDFDVCYNPEFLREGCAVEDFFAPPLTVLGGEDDGALDRGAEIFAGVKAPVVRTRIAVAEMVKYSSNLFHALKICFANELGNLCRANGLDSHEVMRIFTQDTKLNISPAYLKPGFAFGGSCLPKDVRAAGHLLRAAGLSAPVLEAILPSNEAQIRRALSLIEGARKKGVGILGLSFKEGTDDLRESPIIKVIESLVGRGYALHVHDENVELSRLVGANRQYLEDEVPYLEAIMRPAPRDVLAAADVIVVANVSPRFREASTHFEARHTVIDLVRLWTEPPAGCGEYIGISW
jgi:GDP-mannose 6-dehydrogenase